MSDGHLYFSHSIPFLHGGSVGGYIKRWLYTFFLFPNMLICPSDIISSSTVMLLGQVFTLNYCCTVGANFHFETLFSSRPISLVVDEISRNKSVTQLQSPIL